MCAVQIIKVELINQVLWRTFSPINEMIVNRRGRNLFPTLGFNIDGLEADALYTCSVRLVAVDRFKYRYENEGWLQQSINTEPLPIGSVMHTEGYKVGQEWMEGVVTFPSLKITNDRSCKDPNMIVLQPGQKYLPHFHIWKLSSDRQTADLCASFTSDDTIFIAATAYRNMNLAELKKQHNKHAGGKRRRSEPSDENAEPKKRRKQGTGASPLVDDLLPTPTPLPARDPCPAQQWSTSHCYQTHDVVPVQPSAHQLPTTLATSALPPSTYFSDCQFVPTDPFFTSRSHPEPTPSSYCNNSATNLPDVFDPLDEFNASNFFIPLS